jgi:4'-phosphopantetheinyl transferase
MTHLSRDIWKLPPKNLLLNKDEVHIWCVHVTALDGPIGLADKHLSDGERERAYRYHFDKDRNRFIVGHESLRVILGQYLDLAPDAIEFEHGAHGKPNLDPKIMHGGLSYNLSHSGEYALIAVGRDREVGVDVEKVRPEIDLERIAQRFFSPAEVEGLFALTDTLRLDAFYRCWTRKEAYIKARGGGLSIPLDQFDVTLDPEAPAALLATRDDPQEASRWSLYNIDLCEGYQAALVVEGRGLRVKLWDWNWEVSQSRDLNMMVNN